jgi:hypothetical protein
MSTFHFQLIKPAFGKSPKESHGQGNKGSSTHLMAFFAWRRQARMRCIVHLKLESVGPFILGIYW